MTELTRLDVSKSDHGVDITLTPPSTLEVVAPVLQTCRARPSRSTLNSCNERVQFLVLETLQYGIALPSGEFERLCLMLTDEVLSVDSDPRLADLRTTLREMRTPLLISSEWSEERIIHWELLKVGDGQDGYLGLLLDVGRQLKTGAKPTPIPRPNRQGFRCLLIGNPADHGPQGLQESQAELASLRNWLSKQGVTCEDYLVGADATLHNVVEKMRSGPYDMLHFAGHIGSSPDNGERGLVLHDQILTASSIANHLKGATIVFLNGCESTTAAQPTAAHDGNHLTLLEAFLKRGAQLVVGSLFPTTDAGARQFAESFYADVLDGRPVGSAMRQARLKVRGAPGAGAAWASFVLYGDPTTRIIMRSDPVSLTLGSLGLRRDHFQGDGLRVIERMLEFGRAMGSVASLHLFAALIEGEGQVMRKKLEDHGVPSDDLREAFLAASKKAGQQPEGSGSLDVSDNTSEVLKLAVEMCKARDPAAKVTEVDLVDAFIGHGKSVAIETLRALDVDLSKPPPEHRLPPPTSHVGPLDFEACSPLLRQVLAQATMLAARSRVRLLASGHLLLAAVAAPNSGLLAAVRRQGHRTDALEREIAINSPPWPEPGVMAREMDCSPNTQAILLRAKAESERRGSTLVEEEDFIVSLLSHGAGSAAIALRRLGARAETGSSIFDDEGKLRLDRLDERARLALHNAIDLANEKGYALVSRTHVLHALLEDGGSRLAQLCGETGDDAGHLASRLHAAIARQSEFDNLIARADVTTLSPGLIGVLKSVEHTSPEPCLIGESALVHALLVDGCAEGGQILISLGLDWGRLRALSSRPPDHRPLH